VKSRKSRQRSGRGSLPWTPVAVAAASIVVLVAFLWAAQPPSGASAAPEGVEVFEVTEFSHVQGPVSYPQTPPVGGKHAAIWQNAGFYDTPIANENAVHSLEHGAVWITYRPELPQEQVDRLRDLVRGGGYLIASPYPGLPAPVVASAWGLQLRLDSAEDPRLEQFIRAFRQGPQTPERGASLAGGVGTPQ
jgi:hypothetical protein